MEWIPTPPEAEAKQGSKASATSAANLDVPEGENLILILRAEDPLCLGLDRFVGNLHESFEHIPASALRGAVATASLRQRGLADQDQSGEAWFRKLFLDPATSLRFESAWPVEEDVASAPCVPPLSLRTCKVAGTAHGVRDRLILDFLHRRLAEAGHHVGLGSTCGHSLEGSDIDSGCGERLVRVPRPIAASDATGRPGHASGARSAKRHRA